MDDALDPTVQTVDVMSAAQVGKTTIIENLVGYFIDAQPATILWVEPSNGMAKDYSKERLAPMIRDTPRLTDKVKESRSRDSGNTISMKMFPGGNIAMVGAESPKGLRGRPRRVVLMDEVDGYPASAGSEGDPVALAVRRTEAFANAVIYSFSTPLIKGLSRIEKAYEQTDKRRWFCPCPKCGTHQTLKWRQVLWGGKRIESLVARGALSKEDGAVQSAQAPTDGTDAVYECEHCFAHLTDTDRVKMVRSGEWRATAPFNGKRGYHLNGIASPFKAKKGYKNRLHQMVAQYIEAEAGGELTKQAWKNTFLGETHEEQIGQKIDPTGIMERCEDYHAQNLPEDVILIAASADVQANRIELEIIGVGMGFETWGIEAMRLFGDPDRDEVWEDLRNQLSQSYQREDGIILPISCAAIDMRFKSDRVRKFVRGFRMGGHLYPVYGVASRPALPGLKYAEHRPRQYSITTYSVYAHECKKDLFDRLAIELPPGQNRASRYMHFPNGYGYDQEYFEQLTAEVLKVRHIGFNVSEYGYEKIRPRNEALDRRVYFLASMDILKPALQIIAKKLKQASVIKQTTAIATPIMQRLEHVDHLPEVPKPETETPPATPPKPLPPSRRRIRVGRW